MDLISIFLAKYLIYLLLAWALVTGWFFARQSRRAFIIWLAKLVVASAIVIAADQILNRLLPTDRPFVLEGVKPIIVHAADSSFPSTHAAFAALLATFIGRLRLNWGMAAAGLAILVGVGRVLTKLHYPVDVVGGLALGFIAAEVAFRFWPRNMSDY